MKNRLGGVVPLVTYSPRRTCREFQAAFEQARASQQTFEIEHRIVPASTAKHAGSSRAADAFGTEAWNFLEIICVTIDLSAQKQSDLQLQVQREELAHLSARADRRNDRSLGMN